MRRFVLLIACVLSVLVPSIATASIILPTSATAISSYPGPTTTVGSFANAIDGDPGTGFVATNTFTQAVGMAVGFNFDISGYSAVNSFTITFQGVYTSDNPNFQSLAFSRNSNFVSGPTFSAPHGQAVTGTWTPSPGTELNALISGNTLSVYLLTGVGGGPGTFTQIDTLEVYADIQGQLAPVADAVPEPLSVAVWGGIALMGGVFAYRRRSA